MAADRLILKKMTDTNYLIIINDTLKKILMKKDNA